MNIADKKLCCPLTGAYIPRLVLCAVVGFLFIFGFSYVVHEVMLKETYQQTAQLWRTPEDMKAYCWVMLIAQFLVAFLTAAIYSKGHEAKGVGEGLRYGLLIGLLLGVLMGSAYVWMPISAGLAQAWFVAGLLEGLGLGIIYSLLYKSPCCGKSCDAEKK